LLTVITTEAFTEGFTLGRRGRTLAVQLQLQPASSLRKLFTQGAKLLIADETNTVGADHLITPVNHTGSRNDSFPQSLDDNTQTRFDLVCHHAFVTAFHLTAPIPHQFDSQFHDFGVLTHPY